jgi:hypothetical protein
MVLKVGKNTETGLSSGVYNPAHRRTVESLGQDIRHIYTTRPVWRNKGFCYTGSVYYYLTLVLILSGAGAVYVWLSKRRKHRSDVVRVRSRANKIARARLKTAEGYMKQHLFAGYYEELNRALWGYIADKLALSQADSSRERIESLLKERQVAENLIADYTQLIESCEFARYAPDPGQLEKERIFEQAVTVISKMEQALK